MSRRKKKIPGRDVVNGIIAWSAMTGVLIGGIFLLKLCYSSCLEQGYSIISCMTNSSQ